MLASGKILLLVLTLTPQMGLAACGSGEAAQTPAPQTPDSPVETPDGGGAVEQGWVTPGTETDRGFVLDNVLHSETEGDIHFSLYVPDNYDGSRPYAVFCTLPGYEGLYFREVGANLQEDFGFEAQNYVSDMLVVAPQLSDWGETSADQTIALVEYILSHYNIDPDEVVEIVKTLKERALVVCGQQAPQSTPAAETEFPAPESETPAAETTPAPAAICWSSPPWSPTPPAL